MTLGYLQSVGIIAHTLRHNTATDNVIVELYYNDKTVYKKEYLKFVSYNQHIEDTINSFLEQKKEKKIVISDI